MNKEMHDRIKNNVSKTKSSYNDIIKEKNHALGIVNLYFFIYFLLFCWFILFTKAQIMPFRGCAYLYVYSALIVIWVSPCFVKNLDKCLNTIIIRMIFNFFKPAKTRYGVGFDYFEGLRNSLDYDFWGKIVFYIIAIILILIAFWLNTFFIGGINSFFSFGEPTTRYVSVDYFDNQKCLVSDWKESGKSIDIKLDSHHNMIANVAYVLQIKTKIGLLGLEFIYDKNSIKGFGKNEFPVDTKFPLTEEEFQKVHIGKKHNNFRNG